MWIDWTIFADAVHIVLSGGNPYSVNGFYNPVWILPLFIPFVLLGEPYGQICYSLLSFSAFAYIAYRVHASLASLAAFLVSLPVLAASVTFINLDWLPVFALFTPPPIALFLALAKPQLGAGIAIYLLYDAYKTHRLIPTLAPLFGVSLLVIALYGFPPVQNLDNVFWNMSLFPYSIPFGVALLILSIRFRHPTFSFPATLMLVPYFGFNSLAAASVVLLRNERWMIFACVLLWLWRFGLFG